MWIGICPPSNVAGTFLRALVPLVPRPAVLPFEPSPRPTRVLAVFDPGAGFRSCNLMGVIFLDLLNLYEVMHGLDQAARLRVVLADHGLPDLPQPKRPQALSCLPARTDGAAHLGDLQLRHGYADPSRAAEAASASASRRARSMPAGATSSMDRPRRAATSSGRCNSFSAATVACTTLIALDRKSVV